MHNVWNHGPPPRLPLARISPLRDLVLTTCLHDPAGQEANWPRCVNKHSLPLLHQPGNRPGNQRGPFVYYGLVVGMDIFVFPPVLREFGYPCAVGAADTHTQLPRLTLQSLLPNLTLSPSVPYILHAYLHHTHASLSRQSPFS
jgi:hypothetical protein